MIKRKSQFYNTLYIWYAKVFEFCSNSFPSLEQMYNAFDPKLPINNNRNTIYTIFIISRNSVFLHRSSSWVEEEFRIFRIFFCSTSERSTKSVPSSSQEMKKKIPRAHGTRGWFEGWGLTSKAGEQTGGSLTYCYVLI